MDIRIDGTAFNVAYWSKWQQKDFIERCLSYGVFKQYSEANRRTLLREVWRMIKKQKQ